MVGLLIFRQVSILKKTFTSFVMEVIEHRTLFYMRHSFLRKL